MYQQTNQWMHAICSTEQDHASSDEQLEELFFEAGIPEKDITEFLENRAEQLRSFVL